MKTKQIEASVVRELLSYDKDSGVFTWNKYVSSRAKKGAVAGNIDNTGYRSIRIMGVSYLAHRLAYVYVNGQMPEEFIDHIDGNRQNNRFENLRDVSKCVNSQNIHSPLKNNVASGRLGVSTQGNKWKAQIYFNGSKKYLGSFGTPELAHEAYLNAKRIHHEGCCI